MGRVIGAQGSLRSEEVLGAGFMLSKLSDNGQPSGVKEGPFRLEVRSVRTFT